LAEYPKAKSETFTGHELANYVRNEWPEIFRPIIAGTRYSVCASPGKGNWVSAPWIAILDVLVTETAQSGFYPVYLVREDFGGFFLSLNQGVTSVRNEYRADAPTALRARAANYAAKYGSPPSGFLVGPIDLATPGGKRATDYEVGAIFSKEYSRDAIPSDSELTADLLELLSVYRVLVDRELVPPTAPEREDDEDDFEDTRKIRLHKRLERNRKLAAKVKRLKGYKCDACGFRYSNRYRNLKTEFIEAHHLTPLSELEKGIYKLDPHKDFAVLCANCHRMIHRSEFVHDVDAFRTRHLIESQAVADLLD